MKKISIKNVAITAMVTMALSFGGCGVQNEKDDSEKPSNELTDQELTYMTTEGFSSVNSIKESYTFEKKYMENNEEASLYGGKTFEGKYNLSGNTSEDTILVYDDGEYDIYIEINGTKKEISGYCVSDVAIIDICDTDSFKEVAVFDEGPSADPTITIFRYSEGTVYEVGQFGGNSYDAILFDKKGKIIAGDGYIDFVEPKIVAELYEVEDHKANRMDSDCSKAMNKTYALATELTVAFLETENDNLEDVVVSTENTITLKKGEEIVLIKADPANAVYYVKLQDGRKGVFTTHIAG